MKIKSEMAAAAGNNLKNRVVDGNKLELSLMDLEDIPVKDISELSAKITDVDLSCNRIIHIPPTFCLLTNIVRLDLSKNTIENLPHDFGLLIKLQYLDLYNNQIEVLPVSFAYLKSLKWLDLKNNPLESHLKTIAGDCLDAKQCQTCAKKVVGFMQVVEQQLVHDQKEEKKRVQAEENRRKARDEKEREKQQLQSASPAARKVAKEKNSRESINQQQQHQQMAPKSPVRKARVVSAKQSQENGTKSKTSQKRSVLNTEGNNRAASGVSRQSKQSNKAKKNGGSRFNWLSFTLYLTVIFLLAGVALAVFLKTNDSSGEVSLEAFKRTVLPILTEYTIKICNLLTALFERFFAWLRTDGLELAACTTGHACTILSDILEVCQYGLAHMQNVAWELCCKDVGATVTTNAKTM